MKNKKIIYKDGYLAEACKRHYGENFKEDCYELRTLRWFRDNILSQDDVDYYYEISQLINEGIENSQNHDEIYESIYNCTLKVCIEALEFGSYGYAYARYKQDELYFEEKYAKPAQQAKLIKCIKNRK